MQLLDVLALNIIVTAVLTAGAIALLVAIVVWHFSSEHQAFVSICLALAAFAMLGFVVGELTGVSREAAVSTVVPAVLTLLGGAAAYLLDVKALRKQLILPGVLFCFVIALLLGSVFGSRLRIEYLHGVEEPQQLRQRELALEQNKLAVEATRLQNYIELLKLQRDFAVKEKLDLSRFQSGYEKKGEKYESETEAKKESTPPSVQKQQ